MAPNGRLYSESPITHLYFPEEPLEGGYPTAVAWGGEYETDTNPALFPDGTKIYFSDAATGLLGSMAGSQVLIGVTTRLLKDLSFPSQFDVMLSGTCGIELYWAFATCDDFDGDLANLWFSWASHGPVAPGSFGPFQGYKAVFFMFQGGDGYVWNGNVTHSATGDNNFPTTDPGKEFRMQWNFGTNYYSSWNVAPPAGTWSMHNGPLALGHNKGALSVGPGMGWTSEAQTRSDFMDNPITTGTYDFRAIGVYGEQNSVVVNTWLEPI
jgi:hypothetical protein